MTKEPIHRFLGLRIKSPSHLADNVAGDELFHDLVGAPVDRLNTCVHVRPEKTSHADHGLQTLARRTTWQLLQ